MDLNKLGLEKGKPEEEKFYKMKFRNTSLFINDVGRMSFVVSLNADTATIWQKAAIDDMQLWKNDMITFLEITIQKREN